jgi:hypothetical protein
MLDATQKEEPFLLGYFFAEQLSWRDAESPEVCERRAWMCRGRS